MRGGHRRKEYAEILRKSVETAKKQLFANIRVLSDCSS